MTRDQFREKFGTWEYLKSIQDENGIDVTLIDQLLSLPPTQRLIELEEFMKWMDMLEQARTKSNGSDPRIAEQAA
jgi:hypothetical protein